MSYDYYGRAVPQYYSVFDGYRYTNALIASFDKNGEVQWSNIFDMLKIISFSLKERVNCFFDGDDIILSYTENGQIASEIINGADMFIGNQSLPLAIALGLGKKCYVEETPIYPNCIMGNYIKL